MAGQSAGHHLLAMPADSETNQQFPHWGVNLSPGNSGVGTPTLTARRRCTTISKRRVSKKSFVNRLVYGHRPSPWVPSK